jgi:hypothetical protein
VLRQYHESGLRRICLARQRHAFQIKGLAGVVDDGADAVTGQTPGFIEAAGYLGHLGPQLSEGLLDLPMDKFP